VTSLLTVPWTFQLLDTGVVLNNDTGPGGGPWVDIETVRGLDSAPFRETKRDHEGVDGGFLDAEFEQGRDITLDGTVYANGSPIEPFLDLLKSNYEPQTSPVPFYVIDPDVGLRVLFVKPRGVRYDWTTARRYGTERVQFLAYAEDPRIYDANLSSATLLIGATITTGLSFPLSFNFGFGGTSTTLDGQFITNAGNRPTPAIVTFNGPLDTPTLINDTLGLTLQFNIVLSATDQLVVDLGNHTVRLNGTANRRGSLVAPNWFLLSKGATFLRFRAAAGTGTMVVTFRSAWR